MFGISKDERNHVLSAHNQAIRETVSICENSEYPVRDELDIADMLFYFGHTALGLSFSEAKEIDKAYGDDWIN